MSRAPLLALGLCVLAATADCSQKLSCASEIFIDPVIRVTNASTGEPLCDAIVSARPSDDPFATPVQLSSLDCQYVGGLGDGTEFTLDVSKPGFRSATVGNVVVQMRSCNDEGPAPAARPRPTPCRTPR